MIAFLDDLPLIQLANGQAVAFERDWLIESLNRAARKAGYSQWWLAEHVAESVAHYLRGQREWNVIPVERLGRAVQAAVEVIGYGDVAQHFEAGQPRVRVSLLELARHAGDCYELAFFEILGRRIWELAREQRCDFALVDLEPCVKFLRGRKVWSRDCDALQSEIVSFARQQTALAAAENDATFALA
jgi:hypothetical protein